MLLDMVVVLCGQTVATLLGRYYYNSSSNNKWMATLTQSGGSPLLAILLLLTPSDPVGEPRPVAAKMVPIYLGLGTLVAGGGGTWRREQPKVVVVGRGRKEPMAQWNRERRLDGIWKLRKGSSQGVCHEWLALSLCGESLNHRERDQCLKIRRPKASIRFVPVAFGQDLITLAVPV
ncbi:hypothetical protein D1007_61302 [Hordeum vulgare]|nr:hypothetical protein D1007_61302 [Hordeum vulgare]KAI4966551.1 hypothetical protein ZWY2020_040549 [Hordeum vulgare]